MAATGAPVSTALPIVGMAGVHLRPERAPLEFFELEPGRFVAAYDVVRLTLDEATAFMRIALRSEIDIVVADALR